MKHFWVATDSQGYSMECGVCGECIYIEHSSWNELMDAECSGTERQKLISMLADGLGGWFQSKMIDLQETDISSIADFLLENGVRVT